MKKISACLFLAGLASAVAAQTNAPARTMSLQDCIAEALKHNFDVRVERYEPLKAQLSLDAAYAGYDPNFNISGQHAFDSTGSEFANGFAYPPYVSDQNAFNSGLSGTLPSGLQYNLSGNVAQTYGSSGGSPFDSTSGSFGITLDQPLLKNFWIDSTRLAIAAARNQIKYTQQGLRQQLITTISAVENAYFELVYARENLTVEQEALDLAQTQLDQDRQRVEVGSLAPLDVQQDEAQVAQSHANLIAAQFTQQTDENALKNLMTDNYLAWEGVALKPTATLEAVRQLFDVQDSWSKGMAARPDLLQAKVTLEQQGIQLKYDFNQLFPQLDVTGSYGFNGNGVQFSDAFGQINEGSSPYYTYGGKMTMPLANLGPRSAYKSDKAVQQQDVLKLKQLEQNVMVEIDNAVKQAQSAWESVDATKQARVYAEAALDAEQKKYSVGKSTTFTVLQLQNNLTSARSAEIRALANYQEALTNLAQQEGTTLERRSVDVTAK
ncbi:MAG: TolC family protein [Verrucomicrobiota bacterium]|jgi:outer membrane protein TolC